MTLKIRMKLEEKKFKILTLNRYNIEIGIKLSSGLKSYRLNQYLSMGLKISLEIKMTYTTTILKIQLIAGLYCLTLKTIYGLYTSY